MRHQIFAILIAAGLGGSALAQTSAKVAGTVQSATGKAIAGAKIRVTGENRSGQVETKSADDGTFVLPQLGADTYQISASAAGYSESAVVVELGVGQTRAVELKLNTLAESTLIAVSNDAAADLTSARVSVNVTPVEIAGMPLNGRSYSILTLLAPGAANRSDGGFDKLSFSGQPTSQNRYSFDGIDASSVIDPSPGWFPVVGTQFRLQTSLETIQEFRVDSALQPAELGMGAGGQVNVISKSGGSQFHGAVSDYFRHGALAARDFFATGDGRLRMNQLGASAGGPIPRLFGKDRAYFFAAFERMGESSLVSGSAPGPTPTLLFITHPSTRRFLETLGRVAEEYPGQLIAPLRRSGMSRLNEWNGSGRLDFTPAGGHKLALRYVKARQTLDTLDGTTITARNMQAHAGPVNAMASWDAVLGGLFQEFKAGLNRAPTGLLYTTPHEWMNDLGLLPGAQFADWMFGAVGRQTGGAYGRASDYRSRSFSILDNLSWTTGGHNLKAGFEARDVRVPISLTGGSLYNFTTQGFIVNLGATVAYAGHVRAAAGQRLYGAFFQDEWKVRRNLTVNAGLRYEYYTPLHDSDGQARVFDLGTLSYLPAGSRFYRARTLGLAPRLGVAWAPAALKSRTILRWGGAVHYGPGQLRDLAAPLQNSATRFLAPGMSFPADVHAAHTAGRTLDNPIGIDSEARFPERVAQWGFSAQQVLPGRFTAQAGYLGSASRGLMTRRWGNLITGMSPYGQLFRQNPAHGELLFAAGGGRANYHALQLQLTRRFTQDFVIGAQYSWSHNITDVPGDDATVQDAKCLRCEKGPADFDVRHVAAVNAHYHIPLGRGSRHWTKGAIGVLASGWSVGALFSARAGLPVDVRVQRGDITLVDASGVTVPLGTPNARPVLDTPYGGGSLGSLRPTVVPGVNPYLDGRLRVFNPAAFTVPDLGSYGNLGRNALLGPSFSQMDLELTRTIRFAERGSLELRADAYNLLNHPNFAQPSSKLVNVDPLTQAGEPFGESQSQNFGVIGGTIGRNLGLGAARQIQVGLRLSF